MKVDLDVVDRKNLKDLKKPDMPAYDALPYVWGSPEMVSAAYIGRGRGRETVEITANLDEGESATRGSPTARGRCG